MDVALINSTPRDELFSQGSTVAERDKDLMMVIFEQLTANLSGFKTLTFEQQRAITKLSPYFPVSYTLSDDLVEASQNDDSLKDAIICQLDSRRTETMDAEFDTLSLDNQIYLCSLLNDEHRLLLFPCLELTEALIVKAEENPDLIDLLKAQLTGLDPMKSRGYAALSLDLQVRLKHLLQYHQMHLPSFQLTDDLIAQAKDNPNLVAVLAKQLNPVRSRGKHYGYFELSEASQKDLQTLFKDLDHPSRLPLLITEDIARGDIDDDLGFQLSSQFQHGSGNDYGFFALNTELQAEFRKKMQDACNEDCIPYQLTEVFVAEQEETGFPLKDHLTRQFDRRNRKFDFGFYALPFEKQEVLRGVLEGCVIPYQFTPELLEKAKIHPYLCDKLHSQIESYRLENFAELPLADQWAFASVISLDLFVLQNLSLCPLTTEAVSLAKQEPDFVEVIKGLLIGNPSADCGFNTLPPADQQVLRGLFGRDVHLLNR